MNKPEDISRFDIRVGLVKSVRKHEHTHTFYIEEIDVGEETGPRTILSGLVPFMKAKALLNQHVLVCCNFKPVEIRDLTSYGMILAASKDEKVRLVTPPVGAQIGEQIKVAAYEYIPDALLLDTKRKDEALFEKVLSELKSSEDSGVVCYRGIPLMALSGPCMTELTDAQIR